MNIIPVVIIAVCGIIGAIIGIKKRSVMLGLLIGLIGGIGILFAIGFLFAIGDVFGL